MTYFLRRACSRIASTACSVAVFLASSAALAVPTVTITQPSANQAFAAPANVTISATVTPSSGTSITKVDFTRTGSTQTNTVNAPGPYRWTWTAIPASTSNYTLTVKATDNKGGTKTASVVILVKTPPTVSITSPTNGATFAPGSNIVVRASAGATSPASVTKVQFQRNGANLGAAATTSPYSTSAWTNAAAGTYTLTAIVTDSVGLSTTSAPITVTVQNPHTPPTVSIIAPTSGSIFNDPATFTITATAVASTGSITRVDFYNGSAPIGSATTSPYSISWTAPGPGGYLLKAIATDDSNSSAPSALVYAIVDGADSCTSAPPLTKADTATKLAALGKLPLAFEENVGQSASVVRYQLRRPDYQLYLTSSESVLALKGPGAQSLAVRIGFVGANPDAKVSGVEPSEGRSNYLAGNDPAKWHANVRQFAKVRYEGIYPGVDQVFYGTEGNLEYDLHVAPGVDPRSIKLALKGVQGVSLDGNGDLLLHTAAGTLVQKRPVAFQMIDGIRHAVEASYAKGDKNQIGFAIGSYDRGHTLVIDPVLVYSTYLGATGDSSGAHALAISRCGEVFVAGFTYASNFPITSGAFDGIPVNGTRMGFVSKLNQAGTALAYSTFVTATAADSGTQFTEILAIAVDSTGHAYVTGNTTGRDFPTTPGSYMPQEPSGSSSFVAKVNTNGSALLYSTYMSPSNLVTIAVDSTGNAYVGGDRDVWKVNPSGSALGYSSQAFLVGGSGQPTNGQFDYITGIAVDGPGNAYVAGVTYSSDLPVTAGAFQQTRPTTGTRTSGFLAKIDPAGTNLLYGTYLGSAGAVQLHAIALDSSGAAYVTGFADTSNAVPGLTGTFTSFNQNIDQTGNLYALIAKVKPDASNLVYFSRLGGSSCGQTTCGSAWTMGNAVAVDQTTNPGQAGSAWITGTTQSNEIPLIKPLYASFAAPANSPDLFAAKFAPDGRSITFSTLLNGHTLGTNSPNGPGSTISNGMAVDSVGSVYIAGWTDKTDFPTTAGSYQPSLASNQVVNAFVTKINESKDTTTALSVSPNPGTVGTSESLTATVTGNAPTGNVTFFDGATNLGSVAVSGGSAHLSNNFAGGVHSLTSSYAGDAHNNPSMSSPVSLTVTDTVTPPTITLTGINDGQSFTANGSGVYSGASVTVTANAAAGNTLQRVTIFLGDGSSVYWTPVGQPSFSSGWGLPSQAVGVHAIWASAQDATGHTTTTPIIRFVVTSAGVTPPTVAITAPTNGASIPAPGPVTLTATASGSNSISSVRFYQGFTVLGSATSSPYTISWSNVAAGTYSVIALAADTAGGLTLSVPITITVTAPPPPTVSLTSPTNGASFNTPVTIPVTASATPAGGATIDHVDFYDGASLLATAMSSPYTYNWSNPPGGSHTLTAKATDSRGSSAISSPVSITVITPPPPTVSITSPSNGATFATSSPIPISVSATPASGANITRVEIYVASGLVAVGTSYTWSALQPGTYSITAIAYDDRGASATSSAVSITVTGDSNEQIVFLHNDFAGNPIAGTDLTGAVLWRENYTPFGMRLVNAGASSSSHQWFGGKIQDNSTGLSYFGARHYDPVVGRFMGVDPKGFDEKDFHTFNRYAYGDNNPYRFVDPDGRVVVDVIFVALDIYALATEGATVVNVAALGLDVASTFGFGFGAGQILKGAVAAEHAAEVYRGSQLARNMADAGNAVQKGSEEAHHVVAQKAKAAEPARKILEEHGIGIHDAENGAAMAKDTHRGIHTNEYYDKVNRALSDANQGPNAGKQVRTTLDKIRTELQSQ